MCVESSRGDYLRYGDTATRLIYASSASVNTYPRLQFARQNYEQRYDTRCMHIRGSITPNFGNNQHTLIASIQAWHAGGVWTGRSLGCYLFCTVRYQCGALRVRGRCTAGYETEESD